jgi:ATP-dependent helicase HrpB
MRVSTPSVTTSIRVVRDTRVSPRTRIEVVTEGVLTRMLQSDPALDGVSAVLFDEVHERNLNADLGLALCLDIQAALRPELRLLAMSATLDAAPFAALMGGAPILRSESRAHAVETVFAGRALPDRRPATLATAAADAVEKAIGMAEGDILVFLPGAGEINRCARLLADRQGARHRVLRLYADAPQAEQQAALTATDDCRIVLASAIAETSLTVPGVRVVIDAGAARRLRFDPSSGMSRLVTERVSRAEADQRRGRAGREGAGLCLRLWTRGEHGALAAFAPPEIAVADLAPFALELAAWGAQPADLRFLTPPPEAHLAQARSLLRDLGLLDSGCRITPAGRRLAEMPLHPRLGAMVAAAVADEAPTARLLAALLSEGDPVRGGGADIATRLGWLAAPAAAPAEPAIRQRLRRIRETAGRLGATAPVRPAAAGRLLAHAFPDRIAQRRAGDDARFLLSGGKGARLDADDTLAGQRFLVAADLDGDPREATIRLAAGLSEGDFREVCDTRLETVSRIEWDARSRSVTASEEQRLGALVVASRPLTAPAAEAVARAMADGVRSLGLGALPWSGPSRSLVARVRWLHAQAALPGLPDWSEAALLDTLEDWLEPCLAGIRHQGALAQLDLTAILRAHLGALAADVDAAAPPRFVTPAGPAVSVEYDRAQPAVSVRPQWLYGLDRHPVQAGRPLLLELLSPADRPVATTADLPAFWRGAWQDVRKEMRGRYPRHAWPEEPWRAAPATRPKPRR